jgi:hypothetical protein
MIVCIIILDFAIPKPNLGTLIPPDGTIGSLSVVAEHIASHNYYDVIHISPVRIHND